MERRFKKSKRENRKTTAARIKKKEVSWEDGEIWEVTRGRGEPAL